MNVAVDLAILQARAGHFVVIAAETGDYRSLLESAGVTLIDFPHPKRLSDLIQSPFRFISLVNRIQPDIVHAHVPIGVFLARVFRFGQKYRLIGSLHNEFQKSAILMGLADHVISVSRSSASSLQRRGIPRNRISIVKNAPLGTPRRVDDLVEPSAEVCKPSVTTLCGLSYRKGIDVLLDAFELANRRVPESNLYIIGAGPSGEEFVRKAETLNSKSSIHFMGFKSDPRPYLAATDVFVLASRREPFGLAIIEARAAGCAIVASDVDGIPEALDDGKSGLLVTPENVQELADALISLLTNKAELSRLKRASQEGLAAFSVGRLYSETQAVYNATLITDTRT